MAITHSLAMELLGRARRADQIPQVDCAGNLAVKLLRTFMAQTEALAKLRRGGEQVVRVEHVHVYPGGQAIVGNVSTRKAPGVGCRMKKWSNPMQNLEPPPLPMHRSARCGAKTRRGSPCQSPAVSGKRRCRMHGGAKGSGAPTGKRNGNYRHGRYTAESVSSLRLIRAWARIARAAADDLD